MNLLCRTTFRFDFRPARLAFEGSNGSDGPKDVMVMPEVKIEARKPGSDELAGLQDQYVQKYKDTVANLDKIAAKDPLLLANMGMDPTDFDALSGRAKDALRQIKDELPDPETVQALSVLDADQLQANLDRIDQIIKANSKETPTPTSTGVPEWLAKAQEEATPRDFGDMDDWAPEPDQLLMQVQLNQPKKDQASLN